MFEKNVSRVATSWLLSAFTAIMPFTAAFGRDIGSTELITILRGAKIVKDDASLTASFGHDQVTVLTDRSEKATDTDCKIDAILIAKTLVDAFPDDVLRVKVMFVDRLKGRYSEVRVTKGDVKSYGSGQIGQAELIKSIELSNFTENVDTLTQPAGGAPALSIVPGIMEDKRLLLLGRIESMRKKGTNTKVFINYFNNIEDLVKSGNDAAVPGMIESLSEKVTEQEKMREQASETNLKQEVLTFQARVAQCAVRNQKIPFSLDKIAYIQRLVVAGRFSEAHQLIEELSKKLPP